MKPRFVFTARLTGDSIAARKATTLRKLIDRRGMVIADGLIAFYGPSDDSQAFPAMLAAFPTPETGLRWYSHRPLEAIASPLKTGAPEA